MQVLDNNLQPEGQLRQRRQPVGGVRLAGARISIYSSRTRTRTANPAASWAITGEIYKMELDGTIVGKFGKAGKGLGEFSDGSRDRLPQSEPAVRVGNLGLARSENHAQATQRRSRPLRARSDEEARS